MQRISLALVLAFAVLAPAASNAQVTPKTRTLELGTVLSNIDLDGSATVRTFTVGPNIGASIITGDDRLEGYAWMDLRFSFTYGSSTDVGMTCTTSENGGTDKDILQDCSIASGVCTSSDASWLKASLTASKKWRWRVGIKNGKQAQCVITSTGAGGSDQLTVKAKVVAP